MGNFIKKFLKVLKFEIKREVKETLGSVNKTNYTNNLTSVTITNTKVQHYLSPLMIEQVFFIELNYIIRLIFKF